MKTGTLILTMHSDAAEMAVAERLKCYSVSRGRRNVYIGCHRGSPDCYKVFLRMYEQGIDTFCIIPLAVSEGNQTIWNMPKHLALPDNSGSWTMIGDHDAATRFSTVLGRDPAFGTALGRELGEPKEGIGIIVTVYGSRLSQSAKTAEYYAEYLRYLGWKAVTAFTRFGPRTVSEAERELHAEGCNSVKVVPLFITAEGESFRKAVSELEGDYTIEKPVSDYPEFYEILDSKIPEEW